ncbi:MAG: DUF1326 domain-containing protein [Candidatus Rokuibacteriota bacterium]
MAESWRIEGEYLENCNCEVLCPCLLGPRNPKGGALARPTEGHCDVPLVFQIQRGRYGAVDLTGTHTALIVYTPGPMGDGNWTLGAYVDERGTSEQRHALEQIFTGEAGGAPGAVWRLATTRLPTRIAPIEFGREGRRRWARIGDLLDVEIEGIEGRQRGTEAWIDNVRHIVSSRLAAARATRMSYRDHGFTWSNTGRNGHYASFVWSGP